MTTITLHGFAPSTYTRTARMAAIEKDIAHDLVPIAYGKPEHIALHPFGKMPVMVHGDVTVYETLAIIAYLDATFGGPRLIPEDAAAQAQTLTAISVALDYAYRPVVHIEKNDEGIDPEQLASAHRVFDWMATQLDKSAYLSGPALGAADLFFAPMLDYHIGQVGDEKLASGRPRLESWLSSMRQRPSFESTAAG